MTYRVMLETNALNELHRAVVGTCQKIVQHTTDELLPWGLGEVKNQFLSDELVIKISLKKILQCD